MKQTKYNSYKTNSLPQGCKLCVKGQKMVLFVTGLCSRGCKFCPLSKMRKDIDSTYSNERKVKNFSGIAEEIKAQGAKGCSLTGGDPLLKLDRTLALAKKLKETFGRKFHIHIYVSTKLVTEETLEKLSHYIDEIRFHPDFDKDLEEEAAKIKLASKFWNKKQIGVELPMFPDKKEEIWQIIKSVQDTISFLNLNELESGEYSEKHMGKNYDLTEDGYTISDSIEAGRDLAKRLENSFPKLRIHMCTADLKNNHQYKNRLKNYKQMKYAKRNEDGLNVYFRCENIKDITDTLPLNKYYIDEDKNKVILAPSLVRKMIGQIKIEKVEEYPTSEREEAENEFLE
ncbi:MAG: radical SAM protein [Nanoarchaeota archaeon]|jgi:pyruvate formate-lyase activating enzyme-like uncharacterized protein|nr:radical SAM protein [Nanoarchaeota archaeon]